MQGWLQQLGMPAQHQQQSQQQQQQQQSQQQAASSGLGVSSWGGVRGSTPGTSGSAGGANSVKTSASDNWGAGSGPTSSPWSTGPNSVWSAPALDRDLRATPSSLNASLNSFLPGDLLGNESM